MDKAFFNKLLDNKVREFYSGEPDFMLLSKFKGIIRDTDYFDFIIESHNGGLFYKQSLHIYSYSANREFNNIEFVNRVLKNEYGDMYEGLLSFGQDLFGNQFCFDTANHNRIVVFNSETGKREDMAADFMEWLDTLYRHFGYYIGLSLINEWHAKHDFAFQQRLFPKLPFVSSNDFRTGNLQVVDFPLYLKSYVAVARQVHHLPDGTTVKIVFGKP
ncbi:SMI1/KNR4 family protein [Sediminibacterium soli]|uniref:SMI1/KNR4 family protein n=1 Tax=Sediminibacterium soli TaxID=2698829 RepID=UPI00137B72D6|nr:SMI1/KNR4 family protein [Sediminibacterium soli]NCI45984.1 hypothetical protein [Sediminibacterium soli]